MSIVICAIMGCTGYVVYAMIDYAICLSTSLTLSLSLHLLSGTHKKEKPHVRVFKELYRAVPSVAILDTIKASFIYTRGALRHTNLEKQHAEAIVGLNFIHLGTPVSFWGQGRYEAMVGPFAVKGDS